MGYIWEKTNIISADSYEILVLITLFIELK